MIRIKPSWFLGVLIGICLSTITGFGQYSQPSIPGAYPAGLSVNYVRSIDAIAPQTQLNLYMNSNMPDVVHTTQYMDGFGRPLQTVVKGGSQSTGKATVDMVTPHTYDASGRESVKYLAFPATDNTGSLKQNPFQQQAAFFANTDVTDNPIANQGESFYYGFMHFEASPLGRVTENFAPGNSWVGTCTQVQEADRRSVKTKYLVNKVSDAVRIWNVTDVPDQLGNYTSPGIYGAGELFKTITVDENNKQVIEYKDRSSRMVLKKVQYTAANDDGSGSGHSGWICTYYVYDDFDRLRAIIQPEGVKLLDTNSWDLSYSSGVILNEQCFRYGYDLRGNLVRKKTPGTGETWMVYDARDRLVMSQEANMRSASRQQWMYFTYDALNRPVSTGILTDNSHYNSLSYHLNEGFSNSTYPNLSAYPHEELSFTGYDDYASLPVASGLTAVFNNTYTSDFIISYNTAPHYAQELSMSDRTNGMITWTRTKILESSPAQYLYMLHIYDREGRLIQLKSTNISGGEDIATTQYSWAGQPLLSMHKSAVGTTQFTVTVTKYSYDGLRRIIKVEKKTGASQINSGALPGAWVVISENEYNSLGQVRDKKLGRKKDISGAYSNNALESIRYDYNIRGWLTGANKNYLQNNTADHFGYELAYDKRTSITDNNTGLTYNKAQFNGSIGGLVWRSAGDGEKRKYDFDYDPLSRLLKADFTQLNGGWNNNAGIDFSVKMGDGSDIITAYDANGNIKRMQQKGLKPTGSVLIDDLHYAYLPHSNQLLNVRDDNNDAATILGDFRTSLLHPQQTKDALTQDYTYDENGNLLKDLNKDMVTASGADGIQYNHLNLPAMITVRKDASSIKGTIVYVYGAAGNRLQKITTDNSTTGKTVTTTATYIGGSVYQSRQTVPANTPVDDYTDQLQYVAQEEGRIRFTPAVGGGAARIDYDYYLRDHLGNVRMVLTDEQQQVIYPAATLEGNIGTAGSPNAVQVEQAYYDIQPAHIADNPSGISSYLNNNEPSVVNNNPSSATAAASQKMYQLQATGAGAAMGLGITLKVMSGDRIDVFGKSYYQVNNTAQTNYPLPVTDLLNGLLGGTSGVGAAKGVTGTALNGVTAIGNALAAYLSDPGRGGTDTKPRAYINYLLLDEQFHYVAGGFSRVGDINTVTTHDPNFQNIAVTRNGYLYMYCSNESPVQVFFDNLQVVHTKGAILEETHYYPFGLTMAGISSKAAGGMETREKYNGGTELNNDLGISLYETYFRSYDAQTGRFLQSDPLADQFSSLTAYMFSYNNPVSFNDVLGLSPNPPKTVEDIIRTLGNSQFGGNWTSSGGYYYYGSDDEAFAYGAMQMAGNGWYGTQSEWATSFDNALANYNGGSITSGMAKALFGVTWASQAGNVRASSVIGGFSLSFTATSSGQRYSGTFFTYGFVYDAFKQIEALGREFNQGRGVGSSYISKAFAASAVLVADDITGIGAVDDIAIPAILVGAAVRDLTQINYITYKLTNVSGKVYIGRSSGYGDPYSIMMNRYYSHHMRALGYGNPQLDRVAQSYPLGYYAIRGREQDAVNAYGGIGSSQLGNSINPIWQYNPNRPLYMGASSLMFGPYIK